jgi:cation diffusion facilitator family transporter
MDPQKRKTAAAWLSVTSNVALVVAKIAVGTVIGSVSVVSEAVHSGVDLVAAVIALLAVKTSTQPADRKHPFGHGKIENLSGTIEAALIFLAAGWIIYEAVLKFIHPGELEHIPWGVGVMLGSSVVNMVVSSYLFKVGRQTDSIALKADAWHLRTDVWTSAGVTVGLGLIWGGDYLSQTYLAGTGHLTWLHLVDPMAAIVVALLIVHAAYRLTVTSARDLMDVVLPPEEEEWIDRLLRTSDSRVKSFHQMKTRKAGPIRFIEFHIRVDGRMTVQESHRLAHELGDRIKERFAQANVIVHVEPYQPTEAPPPTGEG